MWPRLGTSGPREGPVSKSSLVKGSCMGRAHDSAPEASGRANLLPNLRALTAFAWPPCLGPPPSPRPGLQLRWDGGPGIAAPGDPGPGPAWRRTRFQPETEATLLSPLASPGIRGGGENPSNPWNVGEAPLGWPWVYNFICEEINAINAILVHCTKKSQDEAFSER